MAKLSIMMAMNGNAWIVKRLKSHVNFHRWPKNHEVNDHELSLHELYEAGINTIDISMHDNGNDVVMVARKCLLRMQQKKWMKKCECALPHLTYHFFSSTHSWNDLGAILWSITNETIAHPPAPSLLSCHHVPWRSGASHLWFGHVTYKNHSRGNNALRCGVVVPISIANSNCPWSIYLGQCELHNVHDGNHSAYSHPSLTDIDHSEWVSERALIPQ